jgi:hypothetical protein
MIFKFRGFVVVFDGIIRFTLINIYLVVDDFIDHIWFMALARNQIARKMMVQWFC